MAIDLTQSIRFDLMMYEKPLSVRKRNVGHINHGESDKVLHATGSTSLPESCIFAVTVYEEAR